MVPGDRAIAWRTARVTPTRARSAAEAAGRARPPRPAQLALDSPGAVRTLVLLELSLLSVPSGPAFFEQAGPAFEAYGAGDHELVPGSRSRCWPPTDRSGRRSPSSAPNLDAVRAGREAA